MLAVVHTWPLILDPGTHSRNDNADTQLNTWIMAWIAHQLPRDPAHLFDANIFHPATGTLALSDAMLLVGVAGLPFFKLGVSPAVIHNGLLLSAIALSMLCAFALARRLTGSDRAAFLAAIIFGFAPYRMAHIGHLELQWTMWMPLSMLLLHRLAERPGVGRGLLLGAALTAQFFCSLYYGLFLGCYLGIAWLALMPFQPDRKRVLGASLAVAAPLLLVAIIYGPPYTNARAEMGSRTSDELENFSAVPGDYLRVPQENAWRGSADAGPAPDERSLFPGVIAILLAAAALVPPWSRNTALYLGLGVVSFDFSLGTNGWLFPLLQSAFGFAANLRAPSRFGVLVLMSLAMLAALGAARLFLRKPSVAGPAFAFLLIACLGEYWSAPLPYRSYDREPSPAHEWLAQNRPGSVVLELPAPTRETLWLHESKYQMRSIHHWQPLVNGYSGYPPLHYIRMINAMASFPGGDTVDRLRRANVRFVLINREFYPAEQFETLIKAVEDSGQFWPAREFGDGDLKIVVVEPKPGPG